MSWAHLGARASCPLAGWKPAFPTGRADAHPVLLRKAGLFLVYVMGALRSAGILPAGGLEARVPYRAGGHPPGSAAQSRPLGRSTLSLPTMNHIEPQIYSDF
jgi:hypothetical protein